MIPNRTYIILKPEAKLSHIAKGKVFRYVATEEDIDIRVRALVDIGENWEKGRTGVFYKHEIMDATQTLEKINELFHNLHKVDLPVSAEKVDDIIKRFCQGLYPTKKEFKVMIKLKKACEQREKNGW